MSMTPGLSPFPRPAAFQSHASLTRVVFRPGAVDEAGPELARLGGRRPLVLAGRRSRAMPQYGRLVDALGASAAQSIDVPPHSSIETVERVARDIGSHDADCLVAFGGGSVIDTAKAAALRVAEGGELARHATRFTPPGTVHVPALRRPKLPILAVPLTASGAEMTPSFGIAHGAGKLLFWDERCACRVVLLDPDLNIGIPARIMLDTGMNGLAHCLEGLYSGQRSPFSTALALDGLARFAAALPAVAERPGDVLARADLLIAANLAGIVLASARSCLHHALCHVLGSRCGVAHGAANAVMLPHVADYNLPAASAELAMAAGALSGGRETRPEAVAVRLRALQRAVGAPSRLRDLGVAAEALPEVAREALGERGLAFNPRRVAGVDELRQLLEAAW
ncbi:MAG: iron-containing alcohol dehydrogenase [Alcaligenaceae bacterium]|nr:iron-containing alcohol dehydrogenase [Alcaligenaceae bacterium SAGV5]MPS52525.1 iron-containing alcohol dehydrogenase [Alcaligenaceae bacterium SAGV3]MPT60392.1 iron-containing alcohol dehydrogenase [Alcaligenaceae bacterium]